MYTILQETSNKITIPYAGTNYDFLLIVFTYRNYESVGIFENLGGLGCDYEIVINEVGQAGTSDPENGDVKISPRSTWVMSVYGQDDNVNIFPQYANLLDIYKAQVKGDSCKVYPNDSPNVDCNPANLLIEGQGGQIGNELIASGDTYTVCIVNTLGNQVGILSVGNLNAVLNLQI